MSAPLAHSNGLPYHGLERNPESQTHGGSEGQPQGELNDARITAWIENNAKRTAIHTGIRITPPRAIEDVEHVRAELERHTLGKAGVFHNPEILATVAWTAGVRQETWRVAKAGSEGVDG